MKVIVTAVFLALCYMVQAVAAEDTREPVMRSAEEKAWVLGEMRKFLGALQVITDGLSQHDLASVADAAEARGRIHNNPPPGSIPGLKEKETEQWRQWIAIVRKGFDDLGASARAGEPVEKQLTLMSTILSTCTACHATYRIDVTH